MRSSQLLKPSTSTNRKTRTCSLAFDVEFGGIVHGYPHPPTRPAHTHTHTHSTHTHTPTCTNEHCVSTLSTSPNPMLSPFPLPPPTHHTPPNMQYSQTRKHTLTATLATITTTTPWQAHSFPHQPFPYHPHPQPYPPTAKTTAQRDLLAMGLNSFSLKSCSCQLSTIFREIIEKRITHSCPPECLQLQAIPHALFHVLRHVFVLE